MYLTGTGICALCLIIESFIPLRPYPGHSSEPKPGNMQYSLWFCLGLLAVAIASTFLLRGNYKRSEHEAKTLTSTNENNNNGGERVSSGEQESLLSQK